MPTSEIGPAAASVLGVDDGELAPIIDTGDEPTARGAAEPGTGTGTGTGAGAGTETGAREDVETSGSDGTGTPFIFNSDSSSIS